MSPADLAVLEQQCSDGSGDVQSCNTAGVVYATGNHGIDEDPTKARRLFSVACAKGLNSACANLQLLESQEAKEIPAL